MSKASAFCRLSPNGRSVAAGHVDVWVDDSIYVGPGLDPQWASDDMLYYRRSDGAFMRWRRHVGSDVVRATGFNTFSTGGPERWAGYLAGVGVVFDNGYVNPSWSSPALSDNPDVWAAVIHQTGTLIINNETQTHQYARASCRDLRWAFRALAWNVFVDGVWKVAGKRSVGAQPELLNVEPEEFWPLPFYVGSELWIMTHSHTRVMIRPWMSRHGYVIIEGIANTPDVKWDATINRVRVVWDAQNNVLGDHLQDITLPRVDLTPPQPGNEMKPGVTIVGWGPVITPRGSWSVDFHDRNNPGVSGKVEIINGSVHVTMTNPDGSDRSGTRRPVEVKCV
jgi:hypothetical protein